MFKHIWPASTEPDSRRVKARVVGSLSLLAAAKGVTISVPFAFKQLVDSLNDVSDVMIISPEAFALTPPSLVFLYGLGRLSGSAFSEARDALFSKVSHRAIRKTSLEVFSHLHDLDLSWHVKKKTGELSRVIDRGGKSIDYVLRSMVFRIAPTALELVLVSSILSYKCGPAYASVSLATMTAYVGFTIFTTNWRTKFRIEMNKKENEASSKAVDSLINYETVKIFGAEKFEAMRYDESLKGFQKASTKTNQSLALLNAGQNAIFSTGLTAMMYLATNEIINGTMTVGDLVLVNGLLFQLSVPLNFVGSVYRETKQAFVDMDEMFKLREESSKVYESPFAHELNLLGDSAYACQLKNVRFRYEPEEQEILKNLNLNIERGSKVALVGSSGSGKSTIFKLLFRFYDPTSGRVKVFGQDSRNVTLSSLRKSIAVVPQDCVLMNDTLRHNLQYGKLDATEDELLEACRAAQLTRTVENLHLKLDTMVGERGSMLSGGEKQRVSIARAALKKAPIMLCDEMTANLDAETEKDVLKTLLANATHSNQTVVVIAHSLLSIKDFDDIVVLGDGRVIEQGTHAQLMNGRSVYRHMYKTQQGAQECA